MKKTNQLYRLKTPVDHVWQAQITRNDWTRIKQEADKRTTSCSWIVRYCVFRFVNQIHVIADAKQERALTECKLDLAEKDHPLHRLQLCLYGDDTFLIQSAAMYCGMSVSMLIRVALKLYLPKLENNCVSKAVFFWHGIKFVAKAIARIGTLRVRPYSWFWSWQNFSADKYYNMPEPTLGSLWFRTPLGMTLPT